MCWHCDTLSYVSVLICVAVSIFALIKILAGSLLFKRKGISVDYVGSPARAVRKVRGDYVIDSQFFYFP